MENDIVSIPRAQYQHWCRRVSDYRRPSSFETIEATTWCLPPELLLEVLSYIADKQSTLYAASLVSRQWFLCATPLLYKHAKIYNTYRWATYILTLGRNKRLFHYGSLTQSIDLSCGKSTYFDRVLSPMLFRSRAAASRQRQQQHPPTLPPAQAPTLVPATSQPSTLTTTTSNVTTATATTAIDTSTNGATILSTTNASAASTSTAASTAAFTDNHSSSANNNNNDARNDSTLYEDHFPLQQHNQSYELYDVMVEDDDLFKSIQPYSTLVVSTSSLLQLGQACHNLVSLDLSYTHLFHDSMVEETGEYISTLQHYAIQPGLTHVKIPIETVITTIGQRCPQFQQLKIQGCGWVTARIIWLWVQACPNLTYLDARQASKCSVKRLTVEVLQIKKQPLSQPSQGDYQQQRQTRLQQRLQRIQRQHQNRPPHLRYQLELPHFIQRQLTTPPSSLPRNPVATSSSPSSSLSSSSLSPSLAPASSSTGNSASLSSTSPSSSSSSSSPSLSLSASSSIAAPLPSSSRAHADRNSKQRQEQQSQTSIESDQSNAPSPASSSSSSLSSVSSTDSGNHVPQQGQSESNPSFFNTHQDPADEEMADNMEHTVIDVATLQFLRQLPASHPLAHFRTIGDLQEMDMDDDDASLVAEIRDVGANVVYQYHRHDIHAQAVRPPSPHPVQLTPTTGNTSTAVATIIPNTVALHPATTQFPANVVADRDRPLEASQSEATSPHTTPSQTHTLRDYVWSILKEAKNQGVMELQWVHD